LKNNLDILIQNINTTCSVMQSEAIKSVSKSLSMRNWLIGYYIVEFEQNGQDRAVYGEKLIENLAKKLSNQKGMSSTNLKLFKMFYITYPQISQTVFDQFKIGDKKSQTLSGKSLYVPIDKLLKVCTFSHFVELTKIDDELKRIFYEVETIKGNRSVRELKRQINSSTFERIGLSLNKKELIESIRLKSESISPKQIIKDPYILEFIGFEKK